MTRCADASETRWECFRSGPRPRSAAGFARTPASEEGRRHWRMRGRAPSVGVPRRGRAPAAERHHAGRHLCDRARPQSKQCAGRDGFVASAPMERRKFTGNRAHAVV